MLDHDLAPSAQLQQDLRDSVSRALVTGRPILTHLNADTTWLLSVAYPASATPALGRSRFNVLIDPWLQGPQSDIAGWFSTQWHAIKSSVQTIEELNGSLQEIEIMAQHARPCKHGARKARKSDLQLPQNHSFIDAVIVSHEFTDHCHQSTLQEIDHRVPVFATDKATDLIQSWNHFDHVITVPSVASAFDWRNSRHQALPWWIGIAKIVTEGDALYLHSAIAIFLEKEDSSHAAEAVIYTPHGVHAENISIMLDTDPPVQTLAFMHGLHDVSIALTKQLNLGAHNALKAQRVLKSKYWVGTHDEVKIAGGLVAPFLWRRGYTFLEVLGMVSSTDSTKSEFVESTNGDRVVYVDLSSGEGLLLE